MALFIKKIYTRYLPLLLCAMLPLIKSGDFLRVARLVKIDSG